MANRDASAAVEVERLVRDFKGGIRAVDGLDLAAALGALALAALRRMGR